MEKIQFGEHEERFPIESIRPYSVHVMRIVFAGTMPPEEYYAEPMTLYTNGDVKESTLTGWTTVYLLEADYCTVYLSDDGSIYVEPTEPEPDPDNPVEPTPEPEPYEPTIEELQTAKISEMQATCASMIKAGIDVDGEHFSLDSEARLALIVRQEEIDHGQTEIDFYPDGEPSKYYTAEEMQTIIDTANAFIDGHSVYCNELCLWIETLTDAEEIEAVYYGMDIPEGHRSSVLSDLIFHSKDELHDSADDEDPGDEPDEDPGDDDSDDDDENIGAGDKMDLGGDD